MSKIIFDKGINEEVIKIFKSDWKAIWAGDRFYDRTSRTYKVANMAKAQSVHWGDLKSIMKNGGYNQFITTEDCDIDGACKFEVGELNFSDWNLAVIQEMWVLDPNSDNCPICITLADLGWVNQGQQIEYVWEGGSKTINSLPNYRKAHSEIGDGNWKVGDASCKCSKRYRLNNAEFNDSNHIIQVHLKGLCSH